MEKLCFNFCIACLSYELHNKILKIILRDIFLQIRNFFLIFSQIIEKRGLRVPIVIVCNKTDLPAELWTITKEVTESIVKLDWECGYVECSAKDNINILGVFKELLRQANIRYNLSPAVRRRRQSLPSFINSSSPKFSLKRHSCTLS